MTDFSAAVLGSVGEDKRIVVKADNSFVKELVEINKHLKEEGVNEVEIELKDKEQKGFFIEIMDKAFKDFSIFDSDVDFEKLITAGVFTFKGDNEKYLNDEQLKQLYEYIDLETFNNMTDIPIKELSGLTPDERLNKMVKMTKPEVLDAIKHTPNRFYADERITRNNCNIKNRLIDFIEHEYGLGKGNFNMMNYIKVSPKDEPPGGGAGSGAKIPPKKEEGKDDHDDGRR